jgi:DNA-binding PadR family transcriptional regulator
LLLTRYFFTIPLYFDPPLTMLEAIAIPQGHATMQDIDLVILSIIAETPRYAHEIGGVIDHRGLRTWVSVGSASLYYVLEQLSEKNLITSELPFEEMRSTRVQYRITDEGHALLRTAVLDRLSGAPGGLGDFDLGLLLSHVVPPQQVWAALDQRRVDLANRIEKARRSLANLSESDVTDSFDVRRDLYRRMIILLEQDMDWLASVEVAWEDYYATRLMPVVTAEQLKDTQPMDLDNLLSPNRLQKVRRPKSENDPDSDQ